VDLERTGIATAFVASALIPGDLTVAA